MVAEPTRLRIHVDQGDLDDLRDRLGRARWATELPGDGGRYGVDGQYLRGLVDYWRDEFDWRAREAEINQFDHYLVEVEGQPIHYIHARGAGPDPIPIILTHGWPWTFWDWRTVIGPLANPGERGLDARPSFDVVVPSLPGFGFSTPLRPPGVTAWQVAHLWDVLMRDVLGYRKYGAAGGDWGAVISAELGGPHYPPLLGVYLSSAPMGRTGGMGARSASDYAPDEAGWYERARRKWFQTALSHDLVQSADPQTLAWALDDSPVGLAAWLLERRHNWCDGDAEDVWSRDFLLTTVCLYWFTRTISTSMRIYAETYPAGLRLPDRLITEGSARPQTSRRYEPITDPTGVGVFLGDLALLPRSVVAEVANLKYWSVHETGGHFAPSEQPEAYVRDLRSFFGALSDG